MNLRPSVAVLAFAAVLPAQVSWKQRTPARTTPVVALTCAHDTKRDVYLSLAFNYVTRTREMWQLSGTTWSKLAPKTFPVFTRAKSVYDPRRDRVVLLAGQLTQATQTWEWDGTDWTLRTNVQSPAFLENFELVFDAYRGVVTQLYSAAGRLGVRDYDGVSWQARATTNAPPVRSGVACAVDSDRGALLVFGGVSANGWLNETWLLGGNRWFLISGQGPSVRYQARMCYDSTRKRFVLMGGRTPLSSGGITTLSDTWEWRGGWTERERANTALGARENHFMLWDPLRERSFVFGGELTRGGGDVIKSYAIDTSFDYGPDRPAHFAVYGQGCGGARTAPRVTELARPWIGEDLAFSVSGVTASTPLLLLTGVSSTRWGSLPLPLDLRSIGMPGCSLYASPDLLTPSQALVRYPIPRDRGLIGVRWFHQVGAIDPAANAAGLVWSAGVELTVGEG